MVDGVLWTEFRTGRHEIRLGVEVEEVIAIPPAPPEGAPDFRAVVDGVAYLAVPRGAAAALQLSGPVSAVGWQIRAGRWELAVNDEVIALSGSGSRQVGPDDRLTVRSR